MPLNRIAIFSGLSSKQKKSRARFKECARKCRNEAPSAGAYPTCLRDCNTTKSSHQRRRKK
jgi:hypothetical protein